eukprot:2534490-Amphidinium_carterae.1
MNLKVAQQLEKVDTRGLEVSHTHHTTQRTTLAQRDCVCCLLVGPAMLEFDGLIGVLCLSCNQDPNARMTLGSLAVVTQKMGLVACIRISGATCCSIALWQLPRTWWLDQCRRCWHGGGGSDVKVWSRYRGEGDQVDGTVRQH